MAKGSADANISAPDMDVNTFWIEKIEGPAANFYKLYKYPENYYRELEKIANYCGENDINLLFYIPPTHTDLQAQITKYNLDEEDQKFHEDLQSLGTVVDFDYESWLTSHRDNFSDPFHIDISLDTIVINALINQEYAYARFSGKDNSL